MRPLLPVFLAILALAGCQSGRPDGSLDEKHLLAAVADHMGDVDGRTVLIQTALVDLDGDRDDDGLVLLAGPWFCSKAGCALYAYENRGSRFVRFGEGRIATLVGEARVRVEPLGGAPILFLEVVGPTAGPPVVVRRLLYDPDRNRLEERLFEQSGPPATGTDREWRRAEPVLAVPTDSVARAIYLPDWAR